MKTDGAESKYFVPDWSRILGKVALVIQIFVTLAKVICQVTFFKFTKVQVSRIIVLIFIGIFRESS